MIRWFDIATLCVMCFRGGDNGPSPAPSAGTFRPGRSYWDNSPEIGGKKKPKDCWETIYGQKAIIFMLPKTGGAAYSCKSILKIIAKWTKLIERQNYWLICMWEGVRQQGRQGVTGGLQALTLSRHRHHRAVIEIKFVYKGFCFQNTLPSLVNQIDRGQFLVLNISYDVL